MPKAWSRKDERQYEKIKRSQKRRGMDEKRAEEVAAREVNKKRRKEGRASRSTTSGTGNPHAPLEERSRRELYNRARQLDIEGRSKMDKRELVRAIRSAS